MSTCTTEKVSLIHIERTPSAYLLNRFDTYNECMNALADFLTCCHYEEYDMMHDNDVFRKYQGLYWIVVNFGFDPGEYCDSDVFDDLVSRAASLSDDRYYKSN